MSTDPPAPNDHRQTPRRKSLFGGRIFLDGGGAWDCLIRDLSEGGAKVRVDDPTPLEKGMRIDLKVNKFEDLRRAEVMWVRGTEIGLRFLAPMDGNSKSMERFFGLARS